MSKRPDPKTSTEEARHSDPTQDDPPPRPTQRRIGFLEGQAIVPENFDELFAEEICEEFENGACLFPQDCIPDDLVTGNAHDPDPPLKG